jgi:hypothetical protein
VWWQRKAFLVQGGNCCVNHSTSKHGNSLLYLAELRAQNSNTLVHDQSDSFLLFGQNVTKQERFTQSKDGENDAVPSAEK